MKLAPLASPEPATPIPSPKATNAAVQFEAVLLNAVFGGIQWVFRQLPGNQQSAINKSYAGMAMEALTAELARGGGIGLAKFISRNLQKPQVKGEEGA
jgi:Rod binding domain-containing protein